MNQTHSPEELKPFADGELGWLKRRRVARHLQSCEPCRALLLDLNETAEHVQTLFGHVAEPAPGATERVERFVMERVQAEAAACAPDVRVVPQVAWLKCGLAGAAVAGLLTTAVMTGIARRAGTVASEQSVVVAKAAPDVVERRARRVGDVLAVSPASQTPQDSRGMKNSFETGAAGEPASQTVDGFDAEVSVGGVKNTDTLTGTVGEPSLITNRLAARDRPSASDAARAVVLEDGPVRFVDGHAKYAQAPPSPEYAERVLRTADKLANQLVTAAADKRGGTAVAPPASTGSAPPPLLSRMKVVRTADLTVHVDDLQKKYDELSKMAKAYRGFLADTEITTDDDGYRQGTIEVRVPPESFDDAVERIHQFGKVIASKVGTDDVTGEYMQLEEQLPRLRDREVQLAEAVEKLKHSRNYSAKFLAKERLAEVQSRIEQETFRLRFLKDQVKLATITVTLTERPAKLAGAAGRPSFSLAQTVGTAWGQSLVLLQFLATALIWVLVYFSVYVVLGGAIWYGIRKARAVRGVAPQS